MLQTTPIRTWSRSRSHVEAVGTEPLEEEHTNAGAVDAHDQNHYPSAILEGLCECFLLSFHIDTQKLWILKGLMRNCQTALLSSQLLHMTYLKTQWAITRPCGS